MKESLLQENPIVVFPIPHGAIANTSTFKHFREHLHLQLSG